MRYAAFQTLTAPARSHNQLWRLAAGLALTGAVYVTLLMGWVTVQLALGLPLPGASGLGATPGAALALLFSFLCLYPGLWLAMRWLHRRPLGTLFGPGFAMLRDGGRAFVAALAIFAVGLALPGTTEAEPMPNLAPVLWLTLLAPAFLALIVQVTAEELVFRGYLQTQLAARFASPALWLVLPAVIFGLMHFNPAEAGGNAIWLTLPAIGFGLVAGDLTARCGNLGPAIALHLLNNTAAILLLAPGEQMSGLALYRLPIEMSDPALRSQMPIELGLILVLWLAARLALRR